MLFAPVVLKILTTAAPGHHAATCSPAESSAPKTRPERSGLSGFVQSNTILPTRPPALWIAFSVAPHGTVSTTTSPNAAAAATEPAAARPPSLVIEATSAPTFASPASRTPNRISCPAPAQPRPSAPPTLPAPRIPIFISYLLQGQTLPGHSRSGAGDGATAFA